MGVKCAECGFLCYRENETNALVAPSTAMRAKGLLPFFLVEAPTLPIKMRSPRALPRCFVEAFDLSEEANKLKGECISLILDTERECPRFVKWQPGRAPQAHQDMLDMMETREAEERIRQAEWERQRLDKRDERKWQLVVAGIGVLGTLLGTLLGVFLSYLSGK